MSERRRPVYKIRSAQTWDLIRAEYLRGTTAGVLAARYGVTEDNIRKRANRDKWTKRDYAAARDVVGGAVPAFSAPGEAPAASAAAPPDSETVRPEDAARQALAHASRAAAAGRAGEAQALIKSAEALVRISEAHPELARAPGHDGLCDRCRERNDPKYDNYYANLWSFAVDLAEGLIGDPEFDYVFFGRAARRWRAEHLGPEVAEADRRSASEHHHYGHFYKKDGSIRPGLGADWAINVGWTLEKQLEVNAGKRPSWPKTEDL